MEFTIKLTLTTNIERFDIMIASLKQLVSDACNETVNSRELGAQCDTYELFTRSGFVKQYEVFVKSQAVEVIEYIIRYHSKLDALVVYVETWEGEKEVSI